MYLTRREVVGLGLLTAAIASCSQKPKEAACEVQPKKSEPVLGTPDKFQKSAQTLREWVLPDGSLALSRVILTSTSNAGCGVLDLLEGTKEPKDFVSVMKPMEYVPASPTSVPTVHYSEGVPDANQQLKIGVNKQVVFSIPLVSEITPRLRFPSTPVSEKVESIFSLMAASIVLEHPQYVNTYLRKMLGNYEVVDYDKNHPKPTDENIALSLVYHDSRNRVQAGLKPYFFELATTGALWRVGAVLYANYERQYPIEALAQPSNAVKELRAAVAELYKRKKLDGSKDTVKWENNTPPSIEELATILAGR